LWDNKTKSHRTKMVLYMMSARFFFFMICTAPLSTWRPDTLIHWNRQLNTQSITEIVVPYSTIDDRPHCTTQNISSFVLVIFLFTMSCNFRFELRVGIFCYFLKKMVSEIKRPPLWEDLDPPLRYMYIVVQCGLSSIVVYGTTISE
jgi:hypothetical protein